MFSLGQKGQNDTDRCLFKHIHMSNDPSMVCIL